MKIATSEKNKSGVQHTPIENREITGITLRSIVWLIGIVAPIIVTVITVYSDITKQLLRHEQTIELMNKEAGENHEHIKTLETKLHSLEVHLARLEAGKQ